MNAMIFGLSNSNNGQARACARISNVAQHMGVVAKLNYVLLYYVLRQKSLKGFNNLKLYLFVKHQPYFSIHQIFVCIVTRYSILIWLYNSTLNGLRRHNQIEFEFLFSQFPIDIAETFIPLFPFFSFPFIFAAKYDEGFANADSIQ